MSETNKNIKYIHVPVMKGQKSFFKLCNLRPFITGTSIYMYTIDMTANSITFHKLKLT